MTYMALSFGLLVFFIAVKCCVLKYAKMHLVKHEEGLLHCLLACLFGRGVFFCLFVFFVFRISIFFSHWKISKLL